MLLVVTDVRSLFKFVPANCSARIFKPFSSGLISLLTLTSWPLRHSQRVRPSSSGCQIWVLVCQWILPLDSQVTRSMSGVACGCSAGGFAFAMGPASPRICPRETGRGQILSLCQMWGSIRHTAYNDALFENIDRDLQAFRWAPHKILGFLLGNTKSRFTVHVQLRRLDYDDLPSIDWCISLSANVLKLPVDIELMKIGTVFFPGSGIIFIAERASWRACPWESA